MDFEFDRGTALMVERAAYSEGVSPAEFVRTAVMQKAGAIESGDDSCNAML